MLKTIWVKARDWWQQSFVRVFLKELLVRSTRNANTGGVLCLIVLVLVWVLVLGSELMNPVFRLKDMAKQEGLIVEARFYGKSCGHSVELKIGNENLTYRGYFSYDNLEILRSKIGEPITVWSHPMYTTKCGKISYIRRIQYKNDILEEYNYEQQIKRRESDKLWFKVCWIIIIAMLMYIWFSYPSQSKFDKNKGDK